MNHIHSYERLFYNDSLEDAHWEMKMQRYRLDLAITEADELLSNTHPLEFNTTPEHARHAMEKVHNELAAYERLKDEYEWMRGVAFDET